VKPPSRWWVGSGVLIGVLLVGVAAIVVGQVGGAANTPRGDRAAILKCQAIVPIASGYGAVTAVWRAETSTAAAVAYWQEYRARLRAAPSPFRKLAAQTPVTVCLLSGDFVAPVGPRAPIAGTRPPPQSVLRVLVWGHDEVLFDSAGYQGGLAPETPSDLGVVG
jgi:hypothetical protein